MKLHSPYCNQIQQDILELDWDASQRDKASRVLKHLEECDVCRQAAAEYDLIRRTVSPQEPVPIIDDEATARIRMSIEASVLRAAHEPRGFRRYLWPLAAAACVLITAAVNLAPRFGTQSLPANPIAAMRAPSDAEISQGIQAFQNVSSVFDNRTSWIVLSETTSDVGIADAPVPATAKPVIVSMNLKLKDITVSDLTLAIIPGQSAKLELPLANGQKIRYALNLAAGDPHKITVSIDLAPAAELKTTLRLNYGQQVQAASMYTVYGNYELTLGLYGEKEPATSDKTKL